MFSLYRHNHVVSILRLNMLGLVCFSRLHQSHARTVASQGRRSLWSRNLDLHTRCRRSPCFSSAFAFRRDITRGSGCGLLQQHSPHFFRPHARRTSAFSSQSSAALDYDSSSTNTTFFADSEAFPTFGSLGIQNEVLLQRLEKIGNLQRPSAVQAAAFQALTSWPQGTTQGARRRLYLPDMVMGAETGSGKTLAYLLPLLDDILTRKQRACEKEGEEDASRWNLGYDYCRAIILVPNKELANQVTRMAAALSGGLQHCLIWGSIPTDDQQQVTMSSSSSEEEPSPHPRHVVRLAIMPGNLAAPQDFKPFRDSTYAASSTAPADLVICTPAALGPFGLSPKNIDLFADVQTLVVDEADMLLDGGFRRDLDNVLMGFRRADKLAPPPPPEEGDAEEDSENLEEDFFGQVVKTQHVFVGATIPNYGLKSVDNYIRKKFPQAERVTVTGMHNARHAGLKERTLWIADDQDVGEDYHDDGSRANVIRMKKLVSMLKPPTDGEEGEESGMQGMLVGDKVMVFLNSVEDVDGATKALQRAGVKAVPYHAKIPLGERTANLDRFRRFTAGVTLEDSSTKGKDQSSPVLVCTDLASRGLDVPGVTAIVQLQFATNVVAHLHRMGRCGRAGRRDGRGVIFHHAQEKPLVDVVREAEAEQETMTLEGDIADDEDDDAGKDSEGEKTVKGTVKDAFSRRRGFNKKQKKLRRDR